MSFSERIKFLRTQKRYSQTELSELIGVKNNTIWRWEKNKAKPDTETLVRIAHALDTTTSYLLGETDNADPDILDTAQKLTDEHATLTTGISEDKITVHDGNSNLTFSFPNNEEGRKTLSMLINRHQEQDLPIFANSISGDNNNGNNLGVIHDHDKE